MPEIKALKRVSAYRTSDGALHDTRLTAQRHQARLNLLDWLGSHQRMNPLSGQDAVDVANALIDDAEAVIALLRQATRQASAQEVA